MIRRHALLARALSSPDAPPVALINALIKVFIRRAAETIRQTKDVSAAYALSSGLMIFSNASIEVSPFTIVPLMKKLGVEFTFSVSAA